MIFVKIIIKYFFLFLLGLSTAYAAESTLAPNNASNANQAESSANTPNLTPVLLWLAINDNGKSELLSNNEENKLAKEVKFMGKTKKLDILLPMLDLDDMNIISESDITQFNVSSLSQASMRYGSDLILIGAASTDDVVWSSQWMLLKNGKRFSWSDHGASLNGTILSGMLKAADIIAESTASEINKEERVILTISGVNNVTNYAAINAYLQQLNEVSAIQILRVEPERVIFEVTLTDDNIAGFEKTLQSNSRFKREPTSSLRELNYTWNK